MSNPSSARWALRPPTGDDAAFLDRLFRDTTGAPVAAYGALPDGGAHLLAAMRRGQERAWREAYGAEGERLVLLGDAPVGRLWTARVGAHELRLVDLGLIASARGQGLGAEVLAHVVAAAHAEGRTVVLHVAPDNPAQRLYARHGFVEVGRDPMNVRLERAPGAR